MVIEVAAQGEDCIRFQGKLRCGLEIKAEGLVPGDSAAELGAVGDKNFRKGAYRLGFFLLPDDSQNRLVQIIADGRVRNKRRLRAPDKRLLPDKSLCLGSFQQGGNYRGVCGLPKAGRVRRPAGKGGFFYFISLWNIDKLRGRFRLERVCQRVPGLTERAAYRASGFLSCQHPFS